MAIPGYRWVRGLVREHRYEEALRAKADKTWDEWLDERIVPPTEGGPSAATEARPATNSDAAPEE
jgi:hypothetical protein